MPQKTLRDLVNQVHFAMAVHDIRYYLNGILFIAEGKTLTLVATDGHRLALGQAQLAAEVPSKQEVILPRKTVLELQRLLKDEETPIEMRFANNQAKFSFSGMEFVTKLVEGKFPDYNRVIPKQPQERAGAGPRAAAGQPAARRHPDEREVQGRARQPRARRCCASPPAMPSRKRPRKSSRSTTTATPSTSASTSPTSSTCWPT